MSRVRLKKCESCKILVAKHKRTPELDWRRSIRNALMAEIFNQLHIYSKFRANLNDTNTTQNTLLWRFLNSFALVLIVLSGLHQTKDTTLLLFLLIFFRLSTKRRCAIKWNKI